MLALASTSTIITVVDERSVLPFQPSHDVRHTCACAAPINVQRQPVPSTGTFAISEAAARAPHYKPFQVIVIPICIPHVAASTVRFGKLTKSRQGPCLDPAQQGALESQV